MKTVRESFADDDAARAVAQAHAFVDAGRGIPSRVVDLAVRACWTKEGRKALRAQNPPRELIAALERGGVKL